MPLDKKTQQIYTTLKGGGADVGTEQEFNDYFYAKGKQGYQNRYEVWKALKGGGADAGNSYEEFRDWLQLQPRTPQKPAAQPAKTQTTAAKQPRTQPAAQAKQAATPAPTTQQAPTPMQFPDGFGQFDAKTAGMSAWERENYERQNQHIDAHAGDGKPKPKQESDIETLDRALKGYQEAAKKSGLEAANKRMQEEVAYKEATGKELRNPINLPGTAPTAVQDENGNMLIGQTTDEHRVAQYQQEEKERARRELIYPLVDEIINGIRSNKGKNPEDILLPGEGLYQLRATNEAHSPEAIMKALDEYFGSGEKEDFTTRFLLENQDAIKQAASQVGMDVDDYVMRELIPQMSNTIAERFGQNMSEEYSVKGTSDYLMNRMLSSGIGALVRMGGTHTRKQSQYMQEEMEKSRTGEGQHFNASWYDKAVGEVAQFLPDAPLMLIGGEIGGAAIKGLGAAISRLGGKAFGKLVSTGSPFLAANVGKLTKHGAMLTRGVVGGAANMGTFMGSSSMLQYMATHSSSEDGYWSGLGLAGLEGAEEGAKMGTALGVLGYGSHLLGKIPNTAAGRASVLGGAFLAENQIFAMSDYLADPEKFSWVDSSLDALYMQMAGKVSGLTTHGSAGIAESFRRIFTPEPKMPTLTEEDKAYIQRAFGGMDFVDIAGDMRNLEKILADKQNIPLTVRQKVSGRVLGVFEPNRPHTYKTSINGNTIYERAKDGELLDVHTFKDKNERDEILQQISERKANDEMISYYNILKLRENIEPTELDILKAKNEITDEFEGSDEDLNTFRASLEKGGENYQLVLDRANEIKRNQAQAIIDEFAGEYGYTPSEVRAIMEKRPIDRTDEEMDAMFELSKRLHDAAYPKGEMHVEQSEVDGQNMAGEGGVVNPDTSAQIAAELNESREAYQNFLNQHEEMRDAIGRLGENARLDEVYMYVAENYSGSERDTLLELIADYANASAKRDGFIRKTGDNIDETVNREIEANSFLGTLDDAPDTENVITIIHDNQRLTLLNGKVGTRTEPGVIDIDTGVSTNGARMVDPDKSGGLIIALDENGNWVSLKPDARMEIAELMPKEEYANNLREELGVGATATMTETGLVEEPAAPSTESKDTGEGGTEEAPAGAQVAGEDTEAGNAGGEAGAEGTGGNEPPAAAPLREESINNTSEGNEGGENAVTLQSQLEAITDNDGVKHYEQGIDPQVAIDDMKAGKIDPIQMADAMIGEAQGKIQKWAKKKNKKPADLVKEAKETQEAQAAIEYWTQLRDKEMQSRISAAAEARRKADEAAAKKAQEATVEPSEEEVKAERDERFKANREKFEQSKEDGDEDTIVLANGESIEGHYVLVEADAVTPSHNPRGNFAKSEGFPVDENGKTINDRDYENDRNAQVLVQKRSQAYDQRAVSSPVVVSEDGIVLSGNDRTMSGQLAADQGTDGAYVDYITRHAKKWGFTPEQVSGKKHPRIVFVPKDKMEYNAETFAKFNQDEKKSQSKLESAVKMGKVLATKPETLSRIGSVIDQVENLSDLYSDAELTKKVLLAMKEGGLITDEGIARLTDENGLLSAQGKDELETMLAGVVVDEDALRILNNPENGLGELRKAIAYASVPLVKNQVLGEYSIIKDLSEAVRLYHGAKGSQLIGKDGDITNYFINRDAFDGAPMDTHSLTQLMLANQMAKGGYHLKRVIEKYNESAQPAANKELDWTVGGIRSKEDILSDILKSLGYDAESIRQRIEKLRETQPPVEVDTRSGTGREGKGDEAKGEGRTEPEQPADGKRVDAEKDAAEIQQPTEQDEYLKPRNDKEKEIISDVEKKLAEEIAEQQKKVNKAKQKWDDETAKANQRPEAGLFGDEVEERPKEAGEQLEMFEGEEKPALDVSEENLRKQTKEYEDAYRHEQQKLDKLKSKAEHDSRVRGALDNERRQTVIEEPAGKKTEEPKRKRNDMPELPYKVGDDVTYQGKEYVVVDIDGPQNVTLRDSTGKTRTISTFFRNNIKKIEKPKGSEGKTFNLNDVEVLNGAPKSVKETINDYAVSAYNSAYTKVPAFQFGVPEEQQERITYEKFEKEFKEQAGALAKGCEKYLPAVYEYIESKLDKRGLNPVEKDAGAPADPMQAIEETAKEFKKEQDKKIGITHDETPEQKAEHEGEEILSQPLLSEAEIDGSSLEPEQKTWAKSYLRGKRGELETEAYIEAYEDVRNRRQDNEGDRPDADKAQLVGSEDNGEQRPGRTDEPAVAVDTTTDVPAKDNGRPESAGVQRVEDSKDDVPVPAGERGDSSVSESKPAVDGLSSGGEQPDGSRDTGRSGHHVRGGRDDKPSSRVAGEAGQRDTKAQRKEIKGEIDDLLSQLRDLRKKNKGDGKTFAVVDPVTALAASVAKSNIIPKNKEERQIFWKLASATARYGYTYFEDGITKFNEWKDKIINDLVDPIKEVFNWGKDEVDRYIEQVWNSDYEINGITRTMGEWASFIGEEQLKKVVREDLGTKFEKQKAAESIEVKTGDIDNIRETLPYLLPEQQDDVLKAETQFFDETHQDREHGNGKGMMFTNGTGTGKTYTGLGIVKRFVKQGKGRVLILTPSQEKVEDWRKDGMNLGLTLESLDEEAKAKGTSATKSKGKGVVVTTYANARQNLAMLEDCFDLIVYDESHKIMESKEATNTTMMEFHEMLTNKNVEKSIDRQTYWLPEWIEHRNLIKERAESLAKIEELDQLDTSEAKEQIQRLESRLTEISARLDELRPIMQEIRESKREQAEIDSKRTKTVFLSATPFNVRESLRYAEGYLFSYPEEDKNTIGTYNHRSPEDAFLEQMFPAGYRWRYGRLESHVSNAEALGRQEIDFSDYLQNTLHTMSGRMIASDYDYSRDFPVMTLDHAGRFNQAMSEVYRNKKYQPLADAFRKAFDYNYSTALFEAMKTSLVTERIREHLKRGHKVVVFHRRRTSGDLEPPFRRALNLADAMAAAEQDMTQKSKILSAIKAFEHDFADMLDWEKTIDYTLPREQIEKVFGSENVGFFSGAETKRTKHKSVEEFMKDNGGKDIIVIQEASGKEGISLHDQTGEHQRVEINLALPQSPIAFIQIEGRIYRIGQKSNAIFEYPLLGLDLETNLFAQRFNGALGTTENLALGSKARNLRKSIANSVLENTGEVDYDRQGLGGKDMDGRVASSGDKDGFDVSIQDYYGNQKMQRGRDNREGVDYFPTPEPIGYKMVEWGQMMDGETALEPSAGHGAIARYVPETNGMTAIEPSSSLFTKLQMRAGGPGRRFEEMSFEEYPVSNKHDVVLMNPPYGVGGKTAMEHVAKAFRHLNEGGRIIAIIPDGPAMEKRFDAWLVSEGMNGAAVVTGEVKLPSAAFGRAGTSVRTRVVVIDKVSRAEMREKMPQKVTVDLSGEETIGGLFDRIRNVRMPERTIDAVAINTKKALRTKSGILDNPFATGFDITGNLLHISNRSRMSLNDVYIDLENPNIDNILARYRDMKEAMEKPEEVDYGKFATRTFGRGKNAIPAVDAIRDYCEKVIKTLENISGMTADQMDKAVRTMKEEAERRRVEQEAEAERLREERKRQQEEKLKPIIETALAENSDNSSLTPAGIEYNLKIAHGNIYLMAEKSKRMLENAGIDWQTGHKINKNEPVNARTSSVVSQQPTQQKPGYEYKLDKNTRTGEDMHLVNMNTRLDDADYKAVERKAKANGGYYNRFKKAWHFKTEEDARKFMDSVNASEGNDGRPVTRFRLREKEAPKKTQKVYKLMRLGDDGKLYPLFIDAAEPTELGKWYDADSPDMSMLKGLPSGVHLVNPETKEVTSYDEFYRTHKDLFPRGKKKYPSKEAINWATNNGVRFVFIEDTETAQRRYEGENRKYWNLGINGSGSVSTFGMRPGWHAGSLPAMRQIGKGPNKNLRDDRFVWVEGEVSADKDYQAEANMNPDKDIPTHIPEDGYYMKATNANKKASQADRIGWYVAGAFKANRIMSDVEARNVITQWNKEHPDQKVDYDWERESGKDFNAETMQLEERPTTRFRRREADEDGPFNRFDFEKPVSLKQKAIDKDLRDIEANKWNLPEKIRDVVAKKLEKYMSDKGGEIQDIDVKPYFGEKGETTAKDALEYISNNSTDEGIRKLASYLLKNIGKNGEVPVKFSENRSGSRGKYYSNDHSVSIRRAAAKGVDEATAKNNLEQTVIHEIAHAITVRAIENSPEVRKEFLQIYKDYEELREQYGIDTGYAAKNPKEFVAEFLGRKAFREALMEIPSNEKGKTFGQKVLDFIKKHILRIKETDTFFKQADDAIKKVMDMANKGDYPYGDEVAEDRNEDLREREIQNVVADFERKQKAGEKLAKKLNMDFEAVTDKSQIKNREVLDAIAAGEEPTGWIEIDERTGKKKIYMYLPNVRDTYEAEKTIAHETIGHYGLRELLGEKGYKSYMRSLLLDLKDPELSKYIKDNLSRNGFDMYRTIDEYLADAAEKGYGKLPFWMKVRDKFVDALRSQGFQMSPSVSDVKYMVWLSKHRLEKGNLMDKLSRENILWKLGQERYEARIKNGEFGYSDGESAERTTDIPYFPGTSKTLFRHAPSVKNQKQNYERALNRLGYVWKESHIDHMQSAIELMRAMSGVKKIEDIPAAENFVLMENQISSKEEQIDYLFNRDYMEPLDKAVAKCLPDMGKGVDEQLRNLQLYMIKKHGLERNRYIPIRDQIRILRNDPSADQQQVDQLEQDYERTINGLRSDLRNGIIDLKEYFEGIDDWIQHEIDPNWKPGDQDYSGLSSLTGTKKTYDDAAIINDVMSTEAMLGKGRVDDLWEKTKAVSQFGLDMEYEGGLDSKEKHDKVSGMFEWYVPLRGYDEKVAEEVYDYLEEEGGNERRWAGPVLMNAKGRGSLSDVDVFATLGSMNSSAISRALRNQMKQGFARFVRNHYDKDANVRLVTELPYLWAEKEYDAQGNEIWVEKFPDIPENAKADDIAQILDQYEQNMKAKAQNGDAKRIKQDSRIPYRPVKPEHKSQHIVDVWINGEKHAFVVNGNPRAAQAVNGQLKSEGANNPASRFVRIMAQLNTSYSPDFIVGNTERDFIFASTAIGIKENLSYWMNWEKNYFTHVLGREAVGVPAMHTNLFNRYRNETLNMNNSTDRYFKEFMENGGETGWVETKNLEKWKDMIRKGVRKQGNLEKTGKYVVGMIPSAIEAMNERAENMARFATYLTSRQMGRSITRSVSDAKEVSVNFNRKGAGSKTKGFADGKGGLRKMNAILAARTAQFGQDYFMFYNAGVQGLNNAAKLTRDHPIKASTAFALFALGGILMPQLNQALIDDEDEKERGIKDPYAELPEWIRRNRLCIYKGKGEFITIDLPIELRALYGIGDMAAGYTTNPELRSDKPVWQDLMTQLTQLLPIDFMGEHPNQPLLNFVPSTLMPPAEALMNTNWYGRKIEKDKFIDEDAPRWKRAYQSTNRFYLDASKWLNAKTNRYSEEDLKKLGVPDGDIATADQEIKGSADGWLTDPSLIEHLINGYFGGAGQTAGRLAHVVKMSGDATLGEMLNSDKMPILRRLHYSPTDQNKMARTRNKWYRYQDEMKSVERELKVLREAGAHDPLSKMKQLSMEDSARVARMEMMKDSLKAYKRLDKQLKKQEKESQVSADSIQMRMDQLMENTVHGLDNLK